MKTSTSFILMLGCGLMCIPLNADVVGIGLENSMTTGPSSAEYTSTMLGGGLFGNNLGLTSSLALGATLVTNPGTMPAGLTAGSLDLKSGGAESIAAGDLSTGTSRVLADSNSLPQQIGTNVLLKDGLVFHGTGTATFGLALDGTENAVGNDNYSYNQSIQFAVGSGSFAYNPFAATNFAGAVNEGTIIDANAGWAGGAGTITNEALDTINFSGTLNVTDGEDVQFALQQSITCSNGASCDFTKTLQISLALSPGVTYTSASGVFLTQSPSSVPEPGSVILLGTVLAGLGLWRNCKASLRRR